MVTLSEMTISGYSSLRHFHTMCVNDGAIVRGSGAKELARTIKTFEYQNTIYLKNHVDIPEPQGHFHIYLCYCT